MTPYKFLNDEPSPRILIEAMKLMDVEETLGDENNPTIIAWAEEIGGWVKEFYNKDEIPWCGLFMAVCAKRAGYIPPAKSLTALSWAGWGNPVKDNSPMLGDVITFVRKGGGHVGLYIGEDDECYHILGGNQSDKVTISRLSKERFNSVRRSPFKIGQPKNIRKVFLDPAGTLSEDEK